MKELVAVSQRIVPVHTTSLISYEGTSGSLSENCLSTHMTSLTYEGTSGNLSEKVAHMTSLTYERTSGSLSENCLSTHMTSRTSSEGTSGSLSENCLSTHTTSLTYERTKGSYLRFSHRSD